jgi:hypothetical protein
VGHSGSLPKTNRFAQYELWKRRTGQFVGPGTYNESESYKRLNQERCASVFRLSTMGTAENNWVLSGHLIKYEPGFVARKSKREFLTKAINANHSSSPARAFRHSHMNSLSSATNTYLASEPAKVETIKSFTGVGDSIQSMITPFLTVDQVLNRPKRFE